jgi:large subunit ribosomal protein L17
MKHCQKIRKFGRKRDQCQAMFKTLAANLILKERITTTEAKAKELRPLAEKLITKSRQNNLAATRYLSRFLPAAARKKIVSQIGPRFLERKGGYLRILKKGIRQSDGAKMAIIELVK